MKLIIVLSFVLTSSFAFAQRHSQPHQVCLNAAHEYRYYGGHIDPYTWCSDVSSMAEAICREAGLRYKINGRDMAVKEWCSDVVSMEEAFCRRQALDSKLRTGYPTNVKSYCR